MLGLLGGIALVTALATIITGSEAMLAVLVAATGLLWLAATVRHLFAGGSRRQEILR